MEIERRATPSNNLGGLSNSRPALLAQALERKLNSKTTFMQEKEFFEIRSKG